VEWEFNCYKRQTDTVKLTEWIDVRWHICYHIVMRVVVDTNVFVSAVMSENGAARAVLRMCLFGELSPIMANALFAEYEDVCSRDGLFDERLITKNERYELLDAFQSVCTWVPIYFLWRPNLRDEADNHVLELAVAGGAKMIITSNKKDFRGSELHFPEINFLSPFEFIERKENQK
jgi:uncharacterized protein